MAKSFRTRRVTWPPDVSLCQVRLFLSEEAPSQSGYAAQDHLQAKASWLVHSTGASSDDSLPPGFAVPQFAMPKVSPIKWRCPPRMLLDDIWRVARGEESEEVEKQKQRELKVLEAVYPRPSAIPTGPSVPAEVSGSRNDDSKTPLVPVTPIEEDEFLDSCDSLHANQPTSSIPLGLPSNSLPHSNAPLSAGEFPFAELQQVLGSTISSELPSIDVAKPDTMAAAQAAFTAIMKTSEEGSLIDHELLIKILGNPSLIVQLLKEYGPPLNANSVILPNEGPAPGPQRAPNPLQTSQFESDVRLLTEPPSFVPTISVPSNSMSKPIVPTSISPQPISPPAASTFSVPSTQPVKDLNYYKNLIQQHGEERKEGQNKAPLPFGGKQEYNNNQRSNTEVAHVNARPKNTRGKSSTPCLYFNTPRGCRNGAKCVFLHESSLHRGGNGFVETQSGKRMKFNGEITERS